jgi:hypothetical protein
MREHDCIAGAEDDAADAAQGVNGVVKVTVLGLGDPHRLRQPRRLHRRIFRSPQVFEYPLREPFRHPCSDSLRLPQGSLAAKMTSANR